MKFHVYVLACFVEARVKPKLSPLVFQALMKYTGSHDQAWLLIYCIYCVSND